MPQITIREWLAETEKRFASEGITSARLDSELLVADELEQTRAYVHAHIDDEMDEEVVDKLDLKRERRMRREPLAYIRGFKEFYGREFMVTKDVLIPRPESEMIVEMVEGLELVYETKILDVGTGSGALGITLKLEHPAYEVAICDISEAALEVARKNAQALGARVAMVKSDLLSEVGTDWDVIVANLPYVDRGWEVSPETGFEPELALYADDGGLRLIERLFDQARAKTKLGGYLVIEADERQHEELEEYGRDLDWKLVEAKGLAMMFRLVIDKHRV